MVIQKASRAGDGRRMVGFGCDEERDAAGEIQLLKINKFLQLTYDKFTPLNQKITFVFSIRAGLCAMSIFKDSTQLHFY